MTVEQRALVKFEFREWMGWVKTRTIEWEKLTKYELLRYIAFEKSRGVHIDNPYVTKEESVDRSSQDSVSRSGKSGKSGSKSAKSGTHTSYVYKSGSKSGKSGSRSGSKSKSGKSGKSSNTLKSKTGGGFTIPMATGSRKTKSKSKASKDKSVYAPESSVEVSVHSNESSHDAPEGSNITTMSNFTEDGISSVKSADGENCNGPMGKFDGEFSICQQKMLWRHVFRRVARVNEICEHMAENAVTWAATREDHPKLALLRARRNRLLAKQNRMYSRMDKRRLIMKRFKRINLNEGEFEHVRDHIRYSFQVGFGPLNGVGPGPHPNATDYCEDHAKNLK